MKSFFTSVLCVVVGLVALVGAFPTNDTRFANGTVVYNGSTISNGTGAFNGLGAISALEDWYPWEHHNGHALAEIWVGRQAVNVGDFTGPDLYKAVWSSLDHICPGSKPGYCYDSTKSTFPTKYVKLAWPFPIDVGETSFSIQVEDFRWNYEETRKLLIGMVAGAVEAMTRSGQYPGGNCYAVPSYKHFCNIGDRVHVNLPDQYGHNNYLHVRFYGDKVFNYFRCCVDKPEHDLNTRRDIDHAIDGLGKELSAEFGQEYTRLTMCILKEWRTCEECGQDCEGCQTSCPHS
ncbi:hypothetical protein NX059_012070 [Plenodomus lindquistii]|nr:hypothetical protein NX059_012070 [Plenodomus lindquistii]